MSVPAHVLHAIYVKTSPVHDIQVVEGEGYVYTKPASEVSALVNSRKTQCNRRSCFSLAMNTSCVRMQLPSTSNAREQAPGLKALRL